VSVVRELHAAAMLLRRGIGRVSVEEARVIATTDDCFVRLGADLVTTREVLAEEGALLANVKAGQGAYAELGCCLICIGGRRRKQEKRDCRCST
jgi:hypothetical protein